MPRVLPGCPQCYPVSEVVGGRTPAGAKHAANSTLERTYPQGGVPLTQQMEEVAGIRAAYEAENTRSNAFA